MNNKLKTDIIRFIELNQPEVDWSMEYEGFTDDQITKIFSGDAKAVEREIRSWNDEHLFELENGLLDFVIENFKSPLARCFNIKEENLNAWNDLPDEFHEDFREHIIVDLKIEDIQKEINVRLTLFSNYDCMNSYWFECTGGYGGFRYQESYFRDVLRLLKLNPYRMKQMIEQRDPVQGYWPHLPSRDGRELVDYYEFFRDLENNHSPAVNFVIIGKVKMKDMFQFKIPNKVLIPEGTLCGFYSSSHGGGSLIECPIENDTVLKLGQIGKTEYDTLLMVPETDEYGHTIDDVFGCDDSIFKPIKIVA